jgi:putative glutathione S-transferase
MSSDGRLKLLLPGVRNEDTVMGVLINGEWRDEELPQETDGSGQFKRVDSQLRDRITSDGSSGFKAEGGRYHLYVAHGCPWAHRALIFRALKKLEGAITVAYSIPGLKEQGWTFESNPEFPDCTPDTVNGFHYLHEAYTATDSRYTGKVTVPTLWDKQTRRVVNNESSEIIRMLNSEFKGVAGNDDDYYPAPLRVEIDRLNDLIYKNVNNGVYRCGFARSQAAYEAAYDGLFDTLDELEARLGRQRYLVGGQITEADWRLFPTGLRSIMRNRMTGVASRRENRASAPLRDQFGFRRNSCDVAGGLAMTRRRARPPSRAMP